jgi:hypothetical protein
MFPKPPDWFRGALLMYEVDESLDSIAEDLADDMWPKIEARFAFERWADERGDAA